MPIYKHTILPGAHFGALTVDGPREKLPGKTYWGYPCTCSCGSGKRVFAKGYDLVNGVVTGCGCNPNRASGVKSAQYLHGATCGGKRTAEFSIYVGILERCFNQNSEAYPDYGGRGITVCDRWHKSFAAFLADVGCRPGKQYSMDRWPNNNGNYEPGNVRWATQSQQCRNKRNNRILTLNGESKTLTDWAESYGISDDAIYSRLKRGWSVERTLTTPALSNGCRPSGWIRDGRNDVAGLGSE